MPEVRHETEIEAPAEKVWATLSDVDDWDGWNPTLYRVRGDLKVGTVLRMRLRIGGPLFVPMRQHILEVTPPSQLRWRSGFGPRWLLSVVRGFRVEPSGDNRSRLVQFEKGTGAFAGLVFLLMGRGFRKGYGKIGNALREQGARRADLMAAQAGWRRRISSHESFTHDSIDSLGYDWSRVADPNPSFRPPLRVYLPRSTDDVVRCVKEAALLGVRLTIRANGHSSNDLVTPDGGTVLLTRYLDQVLDIDERTLTVTVQAGAASADVDDALAARGLGLRVIGDHNHVTIGGFASVGGISASSFRHGMFVDTVDALEYVDWEGEVRTCSRDADPDAFSKLLVGLGRHGVITTVTLKVEEVDKYGSLWHNRRTLHRSLDSFLATATEALASPPAEARFMRGLWIDAGNRGLGQFSIYVDTEATAAAKLRDAAAYTGLHGVGAVAGRLPKKIDRIVKYVGTVGMVLSPKYSTIKNAESFSDKILDASVGDPGRYLVAIARQDRYEEASRRLLELLQGYRDRTGCFTILTLYLKGIRSPYLANGREGDDRWVEVLFLCFSDPEKMNPTLLDQIVSDFDDTCVDTGSYRYLHSRTTRDRKRLALIDPSVAAADALAPWPVSTAQEVTDAT